MIPRARLDVRGAVQGVGFRPRVKALADARGVVGHVMNTPAGARVEAVGAREQLEALIAALRALPAPVRVSALEEAWDEVGAAPAAFWIAPSAEDGAAGAVSLVDRAPCATCREDMEAFGRRRGYPFCACASCGPRAAIATALPWDRARTTMAQFALCAACAREHDDVTDHRGFACALSCPACGPALDLVDAHGVPLPHDDAVDEAARRVIAGEIVAVLGVGGFQLVCRADREDVVLRLRALKRRPHKPLALLARDLAHAATLIAVDAAAGAALADPSAPIVVAPRAADAPVARAVAPTLDALGVLLPPTPLHVVLADALFARGVTAVVTSGNTSGQPQAITLDDARAQLGTPALGVDAPGVDAFLTHNRKVARRLDDSVVKLTAGAPTILRAGRGLCPAPVVRVPRGPCLLALGAHLKAAPALSVPGHDGKTDDVVLGAHVGSLDTPARRDALEDAARDLCALYRQTPTAIVVDAHPDCGARAVAERFGLPILTVQHHRAHAAAIAAEAGVHEGTAVVFDGLGLGDVEGAQDDDDGVLWGGEWIDVATGARTAHLPAFALLGGEVAIRDVRRQGLAVLVELFGAQDALAHAWTRRVFAPDEARALVAVRAEAPRTTAAGRWFDALAALCDVAHSSRFEGEAAMRLEEHARAAWSGGRARNTASFSLGALRTALARDDDSAARAAWLHASLAQAAVTRAPAGDLLLAGGCMGNALLVEGIVALCASSGRALHVPRRVPPGDGGLAVGQIAAVRAWRRWPHVPGRPG